MSSPFSIKHTVDGAFAILYVTGFVDAYTAPQFEEAVETEIEAQRFNIIIDCGGLEYISSAGIGVFMGFLEDVQDEGGDIKISNLQPKVKEVFSLLGFEELIDICDSVELAQARFEQAGS